MTESKVVIRKCHNLDEMSACVTLQKEVWNFADAELVPMRVFVVAEKIGGQVIGGWPSRCHSPVREADIPISIRRCWQCGANTVMPDWDVKSSSFSARTHLIKDLN